MSASKYSEWNRRGSNQAAVTMGAGHEDEVWDGV